APANVLHRLKVMLITAIVFTLSFQPLLSYSRNVAPQARQSVSYTLWLLYGSLPLLLLFTRPNLGQLSGWKSPGFRKAMLTAAIILPGFQLAGQTWVYRAPFSASYLVPLLISFLVILPDILKNFNAREVLVIRVIGAVGLVAGFSLADASYWPIAIAGHPFVLSATRLNLAYAA